MWRTLRSPRSTGRVLALLLGIGGSAAFLGCEAPGAQMVEPTDGEPVEEPVQEEPVSSGMCTDFEKAPEVPAPVRTFYVDAQAGNDGNNGTTPQTAWRTLAKANSTAQPGDLFLLSGTFTNQNLRPDRSGTAERKIVYRARPGATAVLDHGVYDVIVWLDQRSHIVVDGLEIRNELYPIVLRYGATHNWLRNLRVHDIGYGVTIIQGSDNRVEDSRFERCGNAQSNSGDCVWIADGSHRNVIARNTVTHAGHGTVFVGGDKVNMAPSEANMIVNNDLANPWAANVGIIGHAKRTVLQCNRIHHSSTSGINYPRTGVQVSAEGSVVRYNEIFANTGDGIQIQAYTFQSLVENSVGNHVYHNTVWGNGGVGLQLLQKDVSQVRDNVVENNIFWGNASEWDVMVDLYHANAAWPQGSLNGNVIRSNLAGRDRADLGGKWLQLIRRTGGNVELPLREAQAAFSGIAGNLEADPLLEDPEKHDFRLKMISPAIDAGRRIPDVPFRGAAPDLGAREMR